MAMPVVKAPTYPHKVTAKEITIGIAARGSIEKTRTYQMTTIFTDDDPPKRVRAQLQYPYHAPIQPDSDAQLACRQNFADGMTAWVALSPGEKETWNQKALLEYQQRYRLPGSFRVHSGCNLFMRDYLLAL